MRILIGFEKSGIVRRAMRSRGHEAYSCDVQKSEDNSSHHVTCDIYLASKYSGINQWDLIILHPPCTALTVAGNGTYAKGKPKYSKRLEAIKYTSELWYWALSHSACVCLENPQGVLHTNTNLPKPQYIQPHQFGHDASKKTGLTLQGLPRLRPTKDIPPRIINGKPRWSNQTDSGQNKLGPSPTRSDDRSRTYEGIAQAMADQWGGNKDAKRNTNSERFYLETSG